MTSRLSTIPAVAKLRAEMVDFILRQKDFPAALQQQIAERLYLEQVSAGEIFSPFVLPATDGSGNIRANMRAAVRLLGEAGWRIEDGKLGRMRCHRSGPVED